MKKVLFVVFISLFAAQGVFAVEATPTGCTPGKYTFDYMAAMKHAQDHQRFMLLLQGLNYIGPNACGECRVGSGIYDAEDVKAWAGENDVPLVYGNGDETSAAGRAAFNWVWGISKNNAVSLFTLVDATATTIYGIFVVAPGAKINIENGNPQDTRTRRGTIILNRPTDFPSVVQGFLETYDNSCTSAWALDLSKGPVDWGIYYDYGTNTLRSTYVMPYRYSDPVDWYVVPKKPASGMSIRFGVKDGTFADPMNYAKVVVYGSEAEAKKDGTKQTATPLFPEMSLKEFAEKGILVTDPGEKTYLKIYRNDDMPAKEIVDVRYILTAEEVPTSQQYYAFPSDSVNQFVWEDEKEERKLAVYRNETDEASTVEVSIDAYTTDVSRPAVNGEDFTLRTSSGKVPTTASKFTLSFAKGVATNYIWLTAISNKTATSYLPRTCRLALQQTGSPRTGVPGCYLNILDREMPVESKDPNIALCAKDYSQRIASLESAMYGTDLQPYDNYEDVYVITNAPAEAGSIYGLRFNLMEIEKVPELDVQVLRSDDFSVVTNLVLTKDARERFLALGTSTKTGCGPDGIPEFLIRISREPTKDGKVDSAIRLKYSLELERWDRATVSFSTPSSAYPSALTNREATAGLVVNYPTRPSDFVDANVGRTFDVLWQTANPAEGEPARANRDYTPVANGRCYSTTNGCAPAAVTLLSPDEFLHPTRSFEARILPCTEPLSNFYCIGDQSNHVFTLTADTAKPAADRAHPELYPAKAGWQTAENRNLSYTNYEDWLQFEVQDTNEFFRICVSNRLVRPSTASAKVTVYRNGTADVLKTFSLAELQDPSKAPVLSFAGFTNKVVTVCVSRPYDESVRLDYDLRFREWRPSQGDGGRPDEADTGDDVRSGATRIVFDDSGTNIVRTLHGFDHPQGGNGRPYAVNDTNDWFRFEGVRSGRSYLFEMPAFTAENANVKIDFFIGDSGTAFTNFTAEAGWRFLYDATGTEPIYMLVRRPRSATAVAAVDYVLAARRYVWPLIGFEEPSVTVDNSSESLSLELNRFESTQGEAKPTVTVRARGWATNLVTTATMMVPFADGADAATFDVPLNSTEGVWVGDWTFDAYVSRADDEVYRLYDITNQQVTVRDVRTPQKDPTDGDEGDDYEDQAPRAVVLGGASTNLTGHLNGIDSGRPNAYTDTSDWMRLSNVEAETFLRFSLAELNRQLNADGLTFRLIVRQEGGLSTNVSVTAGTVLDFPCLTANDVLVCLSRTTNPAEVPVSVRYDLKVEKVIWSEFTVVASQPVVSNDVESVTFVVSRSARSTNGIGRVELAIADASKVAVVADTTPVVVDFQPGQLTATAEVPLVRTDGFWRPAGSFTVALTKAADYPYVRICTPASAGTEVRDASGIPENDYKNDDKAGGAQAYNFSDRPQSATNHCAAGQGVVWLNGGDLADWYKFTGTVFGKKYRFTIVEFAAVNTNGHPVMMAVYKPNPDTDRCDDKTQTPLEVFELKPGLRKTFEETDEFGSGFYVKVYREGAVDGDVGSAYYEISFRETSPCSVWFEATESSAPETAEAAYVNVVCATEDGSPLEEDVEVEVVPAVDADAAFPARPGIDYDANPVTVFWNAGTSGGVQRVGIKLIGGTGSAWTGDRTFKLGLEVLSDVEIGRFDIDEGDDPQDEMTVTLEERNTGALGKVGITGIGDPLKVPQTAVTYPVVEGGEIVLQVTRADGMCGAIRGVFTWKDGNKAVTDPDGEQTLDLFEGRNAGEETVRTIRVKVPVKDGFQLSRALTLAFTPKGETTVKPGVIAGTPATLKFTVADKTYLGPVSDYSAGDPTRICFQADTTGWYLTGEGQTFAAATPAAGKSVALSAKMTGKGVLSFEAAFAAASDCDCWVEMKNEKDVFVRIQDVVLGDNAVAIPSGLREIRIVFARPAARTATTVDTASVQIGNVMFTPDPEFLATGTFTGPVMVMLKSDEAGNPELSPVPGLATLTVATAGDKPLTTAARISGKFQCANRTWTFSSTNGWTKVDETAYRASVRATAGELKLGVELKLALTDGTVTVSAGEEARGTLWRSPWNDVPLAGGAADALARCVGYYTMALVGDGVSFGSGFMCLVVSEDGSVRATGELADGQSVSLSGALSVDAKGTPRTVLYAAPSAYNKGWLALGVSFEGESGAACLSLTDDYGGAYRWAKRNLRGESVFSRGFSGVSGGYYDSAENLHDHYLGRGLSVGTIGKVSGLDVTGLDDPVAAKFCAADEEHAVSLEFNEAGTAVRVDVAGGTANLFTMTLNRATGAFNGYLRAAYDYKLGGFSRSVIKSSSYRGAFLPCRKDPADGVEGRGYFLMPEVDPETGATVNRSYDIKINSEVR